MATYHCSIKSGSKGKGSSGTAKSDYICREGKYQSKAADLEYKESGNMPEWAQGASCNFWRAADQYERENGRIYTEIEVALPREISGEDRIKLVRGFIDEQLQGLPYTVAIHNPSAALEGGEQPHAHIIFSERKFDGIKRGPEQFFKRANKKNPEKGGAAKDRSWKDLDKAQRVREAWERHYNEYSPEPVSCRSLASQGINRVPERHLGPKMTRMAIDETREIVAKRFAWVEKRLQTVQEPQKADTLNPDLVKHMEKGVAEVERRASLWAKAKQGMADFEKRFAQREAEQERQRQAKIESERELERQQQQKSQGKSR
jgi:hypothetical protein